VDKFKVPQAAREEFLGRVRSTHDFLRTLGGFVEDLVLQQTEGPGEFNVVTIVVWRDSAALASAKVAVTQRHRNIGFDPRETVARLGIDADIGIYERL
jgi:heme-degrading monooxygenase HmoA